MLRAWQSGGRGCLGRGTFERWTEVSGRTGCGTGTSPPGRCPRRRTEPPPARSPAALTGRARRAAPRFVSVPAASGIRRAAAAAPPWHPGPRATPPPPGRWRARRPPAGCGAPRCPLQAPRGGRAEAGAGGTRPAAPRWGRAGPGRGQRCCRAGIPPLVPPTARGRAGRCCGRSGVGAGSGNGQTPSPPGVCPSLQASSIRVRIPPCRRPAVHLPLRARILPCRPSPYDRHFQGRAPCFALCLHANKPMRIYSEYKQG